jgi:hypothetical protein
VSQARRVKVFTRSINDELYAVSSSLVPPGWPRERVLGTTPMSYLEHVVADRSADVAVNVDEDAYVTDPAALEELVAFALDRGFANVGVPDGGMVPHRDFNPVTTNPFFNIFDLVQLRSLHKPGIYVDAPTDGPEAAALVPGNLRSDRYRMGEHESYDPFFSWIAANFTVLYLQTREHPDGISTVVLDHLGRPFLTHTWYAREYLRDPAQTRRIDRVIDQALATNRLGRPRSLAKRLALKARLVEFRAGRKAYVYLKRRYHLV